MRGIKSGGTWNVVNVVREILRLRNGIERAGVKVIDFWVARVNAKRCEECGKNKVRGSNVERDARVAEWHLFCSELQEGVRGSAHSTTWPQWTNARQVLLYSVFIIADLTIIPSNGRRIFYRRQRRDTAAEMQISDTARAKRDPSSAALTSLTYRKFARLASYRYINAITAPVSDARGRGEIRSPLIVSLFLTLIFSCQTICFIVFSNSTQYGTSLSIFLLYNILLMFY